MRKGLWLWVLCAFYGRDYHFSACLSQSFKSDCRSCLYELLGADPAMFATTLLANDMGGFALAQQLANDPQAGLFAGAILGAMMGPTLVFTIPVALGIIQKTTNNS